MIYKQWDMGEWLASIAQNAHQTRHKAPDRAQPPGAYSDKDAHKLAALVALVGPDVVNQLTDGYATKQKNELPSWIQPGRYSLKEWG